MSSLIKLACLIAVKKSIKYKTASAQKIRTELNATTLIPFGNQIVKYGSIKGLVGKIKQIYEGFQKMPDLWEKFKDMLGITSTNIVALYKELNQKFSAFLEEGKKWVSHHKENLSKKSSYIYFMFLYIEHAPTLTGSIKKLLEKLDPENSSWLSKKLKSFTGKWNTLKDTVDDFFKNHPILNTISTPAKAYLFWIIWVNVAEISWKITDIIKGFLGLILWGDLIESLPESGLGFLVQVFLPFIPSGTVIKSLKIGWNALIVPAMAIQFYYLYQNKLVDNAGNLIMSEVEKIIDTDLESLK